MSCPHAIDLTRQAIDLPAFGNGFTPVIPELGGFFMPTLTFKTERRFLELAKDLLDLHPELPLTGVEDEFGVLNALLMHTASRMTWAEDRSAVIAIYQIDHHERESLGFQDDNVDMATCLAFEQLGTVATGTKLLDLYAASPEVAKQVLALMGAAIERGAWIITPCELLDIARDTYWYGEEDESLYLEESGYDGEDVEELRANMITRDDFKVFPDWALEFHKMMPSSELAPLVSALPAEWQFLGKSLLSMVELAEATPPLDGLVHQRTPECIAYHAFIEVAGMPEHFIEQVMDDHYRYAMEAGGHDETAISTFRNADELTATMEAYIQASKFQSAMDEFLVSVLAS